MGHSAPVGLAELEGSKVHLRIPEALLHVALIQEIVVSFGVFREQIKAIHAPTVVLGR